MKEKFYDSMQINSNRSPKKIAIYAIVIFVFAIVALISTYFLTSKGNVELVNVTEKGDIDYKVYLKDNKFYGEEYRDANKQYISELISNVEADIEYKMQVSGKENFNYTYRVESMVYLKDSKTNNPLYEDGEIIIEEKTLNNEGKSKVAIQEKIDIDYNKYNEMLSEFVEYYGVSNTTVSEIVLTLYVKSDITGESKMSLTMPIVAKSVAMELKKEFVSEKNGSITSIVESQSKKEGIKIVPLVGLGVSILIVLASIYLLIKYIKDTRTEEEVYVDTRKKIISVYGSAINQIDEYDFSSNNYQIIKLNSFDDLMKIKEDLSQPILMIDKKTETSTMFFIQSNVNSIYMFVLSEKRPLLAEKNIESDEHEKITF